MKKLLFTLSILFLGLNAQAQRYDIITQDICWNTGSVDSSLTRYFLVSPLASTVKVLAHLNSGGQKVDVSGGTFSAGHCGCCGGTTTSTTTNSPASSGLFNDGDTIKLGGQVRENTSLGGMGQYGLDATNWKYLNFSATDSFKIITPGLIDAAIDVGGLLQVNSLTGRVEFTPYAFPLTAGTDGQFQQYNSATNEMEWRSPYVTAVETDTSYRFSVNGSSVSSINRKEVIVNNISEISNLFLPSGFIVISNGLDSLGPSRFVVEEDSINGWVNDGYLVVRTASNKYAIIDPQDNILRPRYAGAKVNDGLSDTKAEQRMFDFIKATRSTDRRWNVVYDPGNYNRKVRDTVFLPNQFNSSGAVSAEVSITGFNALILVDSFAIGHYLKANDSPSTPGTTNFKLYYQGFGFKSSSIANRSKGTFFAGLCRSDIGNLKYEGLDTAMVNSFALGNNYHDIWFSLNKNVNFLGCADDFFKTWSGSTEQNSAFNVNRISGLRIYGLQDAKSHIEIIKGGGNSIYDIISEGAEPDVNIIIDENFVPVFYGNRIENVHFEDQGPGSVCIDARRIMGVLRLTDVFKATSTGVDTIFRYDDGGTGYFIVDNVTFPYHRIDGSLDIRSTPKSSAPTYPFTSYLASKIIGYDRRFVIVKNSRNIINVSTIAGEQQGGATFGLLTILGSLMKHPTEAKAQRLGNSYNTFNGQWWDGVYADHEGFISRRTGGGFGFEHTNEKLRDDAKRGPSELRFAYDNPNHKMYWNWPIQGRNMELDSTGYFRLNKYDGSLNAEFLAKTRTNKFASFSTDGTVYQDSITNPQGGTNTIQAGLDSLNAHITALEAAAPNPTIQGNSPTATSGTTLVITHNLGLFPSAIHITPAGDIGNWHLSGINTTTMTLNYETATPSSVTIYWQVE